MSSACPYYHTNFNQMVQQLGHTDTELQNTASRDKSLELNHYLTLLHPVKSLVEPFSGKFTQK